MSTLAERMADFEPRTAGHIDVPDGLWEELAGEQASRAAFDEGQHPRDPADGRWIKHANWSDSRDGTTGRRSSTIGQAGDFHGWTQEHPVPGSDWRSGASEHHWRISRQYAEGDHPPVNGSNWSPDLASGKEPTLAKAKAAAMRAMKEHRKAHIAAGGDVGYNPSLHEVQGKVSRADWDPAKHPRIPGGTGGGRFTAKPGHAGAGPWDHAGKHVTYHGNLGIDRQHMPQLSGVGGDGAYHPSAEMVPQFIEHLRKQGIGVRERRVSPEDLKPTQTTGDVAAIRRIADHLKSGELDDTKPVTVSRDNRLLDGHHNWAGRLLAGREGGREGLHPDMRVVQTDLPMRDLIAQARGFAAEHGIRQRAAGEFANPQFASRGLDWPAAEQVLVRAAIAGHHVPGTPLDWQHGWDPLTLDAAKSHYHGKVPPYWRAPGQDRPDRKSGTMSHGDWHEGHQAVAPAPAGILGNEKSRQVTVPGEKGTHTVKGSWSDPWWMTRPGGGWAVSRRWKHKAQAGTDWTGVGGGGSNRARTFGIPAADERVLTPVDSTGNALEGPSGTADREFPAPHLAAANAAARAKRTGDQHYVTRAPGGRWQVTAKRPSWSDHFAVDAAGQWSRFDASAPGRLRPVDGPPTGRDWLSPA